MLKKLSEEEFKRRAASAGRVAVFKEFLADRETPVAALSRLDDDEEAFLLESVAGGETRGRYSYLGIEPRGHAEGANALAELKSSFAAARYAPALELPEFQGGAVGYVAYDAVRIFEPKVALRSEEGTPPMAFLVCDKFLVFDNVRDTVTIVVIADAAKAGAYAESMKEIERIYAKMLSAESIARLMCRQDGGAPSQRAASNESFQP